MARDAIVAALLDPAGTLGLGEPAWDLLIRQGRRANLLARLAHVLNDAGLLEQVPEAPRQHLRSALLMVERQHLAMHWEVNCIRLALAEAIQPVVLLKGAAYVMAGLPAAHGRTFSDVDVLVPRALLDQAESRLMIHGWQGSHHDEYDQRYYRRWMHEIPPMRHISRGTTIDLHHAILPETARVKVDNAALLGAAIPLDGQPGLFVLRPVDMLLHSATHLFHEGELGNGLRDLFDLDGLFRHFGQTPGFWEALAPRARALGLGRPLYYAIRYVRMLLDTPIPERVVEAVASFAPTGPVRALQDFCYRRMLRPHHASCRDWGTHPAALLLYVRSHWLRMPFFLLAAHLTRKAFTRPKLPKLEPGLGKDAGQEG
ncbi:MAG: nucleotidyltransferase family protein [Pseudomonadota bacterium]